MTEVADDRGGRAQELARCEHQSGSERQSGGELERPGTGGAEDQGNRRPRAKTYAPESFAQQSGRAHGRTAEPRGKANTCG